MEPAVGPDQLVQGWPSQYPRSGRAFQLPSHLGRVESHVAAVVYGKGGDQLTKFFIRVLAFSHRVPDGDDAVSQRHEAFGPT